MSPWKVTAAALAWCFATVTAPTLPAQSNLNLHLKGVGKAEFLRARYRCDGNGAAMGLPAGVFTVRYVRAGESSLAIVPLHGQDVVFAQLLSADGSRYGAGRFVWWDARTPTFSDGEGPDAKLSTCKAAE